MTRNDDNVIVNLAMCSEIGTTTSKIGKSSKEGVNVVVGYKEKEKNKASSEVDSN